MYTGLFGNARKPAYMKGDCTLGCLAGWAVGGRKMFPPPTFQGAAAVVDPVATDDKVEDLPDGGKEDKRAMLNTASQQHQRLTEEHSVLSRATRRSLMTSINIQ
jgi:hypothetical protein